MIGHIPGRLCVLLPLLAVTGCAPATLPVATGVLGAVAAGARADLAVLDLFEGWENRKAIPITPPAATAPHD